MKLVLEPNLLDTKSKELIALGNGIAVGDKHDIAIHVEKALDAGFSREEILRIASNLMRDGPALSSIVEFLRVLRYEENRRAEFISWVDDVREE